MNSVLSFLFFSEFKFIPCPVIFFLINPYRSDKRSPATGASAVATGITRGENPPSCSIVFIRRLLRLFLLKYLRGFFINFFIFFFSRLVGSTSSSSSSCSPSPNPSKVVVGNSMPSPPSLCHVSFLP